METEIQINIEKQKQELENCICELINQNIIKTTPRTAIFSESFWTEISGGHKMFKIMSANDDTYAEMKKYKTLDLIYKMFIKVLSTKNDWVFILNTYDKNYVKQTSTYTIQNKINSKNITVKFFARNDDGTDVCTTMFKLQLQ